MYRITERKSNGFVTLGERPRVECDGIFCGYASNCNKVMDRTCPHIVMVDRLADYEDTGLMPNEVSKLKSDHAQARESLRVALDTANANAKLFDMMRAERDEAINRMERKGIEMNITEYDVVYNERVYHCIDLQPEWGPDFVDDGSAGINKPKSLHVLCIDADANVVDLYDDSLSFRFVRRANHG